MYQKRPPSPNIGFPPIAYQVYGLFYELGKIAPAGAATTLQHSLVSADYLLGTGRFSVSTTKLGLKNANPQNSSAERRPNDGLKKKENYSYDHH